MTITNQTHSEARPSAFDQTRLVFFDMDSTILDVTPYHRKNFLTVLNKFYGVEELPKIDNSGYPMMTAMQRICTAAGVGENLIKSHLAEVEHMLVENMQAILPEDLNEFVLPGAVDLLERLTQAQIPMGLTTGSLRDVAVPILKRTGLLKYFPLTVFGDHAGVREDMVRSALEKATWVYGLAPEEIALVTVGDAASDIRAGKAFNAKTIAVTTGRSNAAQLSKYDPDLIVGSLSDTEMLFNAILG